MQVLAPKSVALTKTAPQLLRQTCSSDTRLRALCWFTLQHSHSVLPCILGRFGWFPTNGLQQILVCKAEDLNLERATALDHVLLAVCTKSPQ
jgi:hypothetical protein